MRWGTEWPARHDLSSLRLLGSVGEPINPEAWMWYQEHIGHERCPVIDTWWQTETGQILISPLPGLTPLKPGSATRPFPGITAEIRNVKGEPIKQGAGLLALTKPWPACCAASTAIPIATCSRYWSKWPDGAYFTGDGAHVDQDGYYWLLGRVDDVLNVAGHRIGTMEVESALVDHPEGRGSGGRRAAARDQGAGDRGVRDAQGRLRADPGADRRAEAARRQQDWRDRAARIRFSTPPTCRRRVRARSCAACCATSPKGRRSATRRRWPIRPSWRG